MGKQKRNLLTLLILLLTACAQATPVSTPTLTPLATSTETLVPTETSTFTPEPTVTFTVTPEPTATQNICPDYETEAPEDPLDPKSYIGKYYDHNHLPEGFEFRGFLVLRKPSSGNEDFYVLSIFDWHEIPTLHLVKLTCKNTEEDSTWETQDVVIYPNFNTYTDNVIFPCFIEQNIEKGIFAVGNGYYTLNPIYQGWTINLETEKFEVFPTDGLTCSGDFGK